MRPAYVDRALLEQFLDQLGQTLARPARLLLAGETSQVFEGWREYPERTSTRSARDKHLACAPGTRQASRLRSGHEWTKRIEFAAEVAPGDRSAFDEALRQVSIHVGVEAFEESPGDVIPLPTDYEKRTRAAGDFGALQVYHFDPYSVAFRLIARGDEPDYHAALAYLERGWLKVDEMNALLADLLPQFTSETIQQDPAEFRRKYKGLLQMWRAAQAV